jgi:putative PIN family toxin of toxin-antitoxin system
MTDSNRFVADTNVLLSRAMFRNSTPSQALRHATSVSRLIVSIETLEELQDVLFRSKFDTYINLNDRLSFFETLKRNANFIESVPPVSACRDPEDDKFLALALTGHAEFILTGDQDLLSLHPFQGIDILSPRQYLDRQQT